MPQFVRRRVIVNKQGFVLGFSALILVVAVAAVAGYNWLLGPTLAASGEITAIPLVVAESTAAPQATVTEPEPAATAAATETGAADLVILQISQAESEVRFTLTEELRGQPTTVVGASDQVAGEIAVDPADLSTVQVGVIQVNARTLATDSTQRDRAIRNQILRTDDYEYITFTPTAVIGLSGAAVPGSTYTFQIAGDLTIRGVTQSVVFDVTATAGSQSQLSGTASVTIQRSDYGLAIPSVPSVANVSEAVQLAIDFVALAS
jgi:polyisoprenoid-binding protein YceI